MNNFKDSIEPKHQHYIQCRPVYLRSMKETKGILILLCYTENATLKQTLNAACPLPWQQRLASSVLELTETLQSHPFYLRISMIF